MIAASVVIEFGGAAARLRRTPKVNTGEYGTQKMRLAVAQEPNGILNDGARCLFPLHDHQRGIGMLRQHEAVVYWNHGRRIQYDEVILLSYGREQLCHAVRCEQFLRISCPSSRGNNG